jgi:glycosyltransferase involved in cell wall biosynthesis
MRVLVAHNRYRSGLPSGENSAVQAEIGVLRAAGVDVLAYLPDSDGIPDLSPVRRLGVAIGPVANPGGVRDLIRLIAEFRPDVLHLHNVYPLVSPWAIRAARARGVPVVQTVHNYRHSCVAGSRYRDGAPCDDCVGRRFALPAIRHACYRGSRPQSAAMVLGGAVHRGTWLAVDRFLALTPFLRQELLGLGVPAHRIVLRPNSVPDPGPPSPLGRNVVIAGRLDETKGVHLLLRAWSRAAAPTGTRLRIVGDGPLRESVHHLARGRPDVDLVGPLDPAGVDRELRAATLVAIPSLWYEGQPLVYVEALAHGRPVLATDVGSLAGLGELGVGWSVPPTEQAIACALTVLHDPETLRLRGARARLRYEREHLPARTIETVLDVYRSIGRPSGTLR